MVSKIDATLRIIAVLGIFVWVLLYGSIFEVPYPNTLVELHALPAWRFALAILVLVACIWCRNVGIVVALGVFFYLSDLEKLTTPFVNLQLK